MVSHSGAVQLRISSHMHIACVELGVYLGFMKRFCHWILMAVVVLGRQCGGGTSHKLLVDSEDVCR